MKRRTTRIWATTLVAATAAAGALATTVLGQAQSTAQSGRVTLAVDGQDIGPILRISGLTSEVEMVEYQQARERGTSSRFAGRAKPATVTITRTLTGNFRFHEWHAQARSGDPRAMREATLTTLSSTGKPVARWQLVNAWPSRLEVQPAAGDDPKSKEGVVLLEIVTLTADEIVRAAP